MADGGVAIVAIGAAVVAGVQAWIAHRKLKLDLFTKRFEAYESLNDAINARRIEITQFHRGRVEVGTSEALRTIWRQQRLMHVLFPIDVAETLQQIDQALIAYTVSQVDFAAFSAIAGAQDAQAMGQRYEALMGADRDLYLAQEELGLRTLPYLRQYGQVEIWRVKGGRTATRLWDDVQRKRAALRPRKTPIEDVDAS